MKPIILQNAADIAVSIKESVSPHSLFNIDLGRRDFEGLTRWGGGGNQVLRLTLGGGSTI